MPKVNCEKCGDAFKAKPANLKRGKDRFCSGECYKKFMHDENYVKIKCRGCEIEIEVTKYKLSIGVGTYHSRECFIQNMSKVASERSQYETYKGYDKP